VADASLDADAKGRQPPVGAPRAGALAAGDEDARGAGQVFGDADREEAAVERDLARAQVQTVQFRGGGGQQSGWLGQPIWLAAGTIRPRAPRRVFSQTSASWTTEPNSVGARSLPSRIDRASGSVMETSRLVIFSPARR
jgi:hypothetical protein